MTWVATRSRNQRSWLMTTAQPAKLKIASSKARSVSTSRSFVGSSSSSRLQPRRKQLGQVHAVPLAARQIADLLLLVGAGEIEPGHVGPGVDLAAAHFDRVVPAGDFFEHRVVGGQSVAVLVDVAHVRRSDPMRIVPESGFSVPMIMRNSVVLPAPLGPMMPDDAAGRQAEAEIFEQHLIAIGLGDFVGLDDQFAERLARRNLNFELLFLVDDISRPTFVRKP